MRARTLVIPAVVALLMGGAVMGYMLHTPAMPAGDYTRAAAATGPKDLTVRFLGTASLSLDDGSTAIMTDGFFSRPGIPQVLLGKIQTDDKRVDETLNTIGLRKLAALLVAHSHYDHAMDSAAVAMKTGATVYGSESTANIMRGSSLPADRTKVFADGDTFTFGRFQVTVFETPHSPHAKFPGNILEPLHQPANVSDYHEGGNYSFLVKHGERRILIIASGNYTPGKFKDIKADTVFLGIATLGKQGEKFAAEYWHEAVQLTGAKLVIPIHWDNFFLPLNEPFRPLPPFMDDFASSMRMLEPLAKRDNVKLQLPEAFTAIDLDQ